MMEKLPVRYPLLVLALLILAGCGSPARNNYYLLSATETHSNSQAPALGIGPIEIPEYLNRSGLVFDQQGNKLFIASHERWAEPLTDGILRVVSLNLSGLLKTENVQAFPWLRGEQPDYGVQVTVMSLDANDTQATMVAEWVIQRPGDDSSLTRRISQLTQEMPTGEVMPEQIAPAYSKLLYQLSELVAGVISADMASRQKAP